MSETQQQSSPDDFSIDAAIAQARNRIKSSSREALPQMSTSEIVGTPTDSGRSFASVEEMDASHTRRDLPAREENVKTLGDLLAKYHVGEDPDFKALLYREYPKVFPGGIIAGGYYETYDQPFTEQTIAESYGGGQYRVVIHGPRPNSVHGVQHYASVVLKIAGEPRVDRVPRHGVAAPLPGSPAPQPQSPPPSEGMVDKTLSTLEGIYRNERDERLNTRQETEQRLAEARREAEFRQAEATRASRESMDTMSAVYEKHNRDIIESERAAHERERRLIDERMQEREARMAETERQREDERRRFAEERRSAPDPYDAITRTFGQAAELFKGDGGASQQRILESVLQKHKEEVAALRDESTRAMERIQQANTHEAAALREAARREVEAERLSSASRERDLMRQIEAAREERGRDIERYREDLANREQAAKDRLETQRETLNMQSEGRYETLRQQSELRLTSSRDDVERMRHELDELRSSVREDKDPLAGIQRTKALLDTLQHNFGYEKADSRSGGIGSDTPATTASSFDWGKAAEMLMEKGPEYLQGLGTLIRGPQQTSQPTQPPPQVGQILNLPNGTFQVVQVQPSPQNPQGLGMIPYNPPQPVPTRLANPQQRALPAPQAQQKRPQQQAPAREGEMSSEMPRPRRPARPAQSASTSTAVAPVPVSPPAIKAPRPPPTDMEKQAATVIGGLLNAAIMSGDEPEDMLAGIVDKFPPEILVKVAQYEVEDLFALLREIQPNSAVFTPAGVIFTQTVFLQLRATLKM